MAGDAKGCGAPTQWRVAKDKKTGREYYYHAVTKETTWTKPMELLTEAELAEAIRKKEEARLFFCDMEQNILRRVSSTRGDDSDQDNNDDNEAGDSFPSYEHGRESFIESSSFGGRTRRGSISGIRQVRTISSIDDEILEMLRYSTSHEEGGSIANQALYGVDNEGSDSRPSSYTKAADMKEAKAFLESEAKGVPIVQQPRDGPKVKAAATAARGGEAAPQPTRRRRNSTGTIYVDSTMSKQDNEHTIKCVCVVIRAHMMEAAKENFEPRKEYDVFKDLDASSASAVADAKYSSDDRSRNLDAKGSQRSLQKRVPSVDTVTEFFTYIFEKSQLEHECIIIALIYVERLVKATKGRLCLRYDNWKSIVFACLIMASKVWDDLSMWNVDFSQVLTNFDLQRINELEMALLDALQYTVKVPASEYAKYYFHLRSMMARLGYHMNNSDKGLQPLNILDARKLELATEKYEESWQVDTRRRGASMHVMPEMLRNMPNLASSADAISAVPYQDHKASVGLEQLLHDEHINADGSAPKKSQKLRSGKSNEFK